MKIIFLGCLLLLYDLGFSQIKSLISSSGQEIENEYSISSSMGQTAVNQVSKGGYSLSEGFNQTFVQKSNHNITDETISELFKIVDVYPNPSSGDLHVIATNIIQSLEVYDFRGQRLKKLYPNEDSYRLDMDGLPQGMYLVKVILKDDTHQSFKIIKI